MRLFKCRSCGQVLDFENTICERCSHLGYLPNELIFSALEAEEAMRWQTLAKPAQ
jgi:hypothetical protein